MGYVRRLDETGEVQDEDRRSQGDQDAGIPRRRDAGGAQRIVYGHEVFVETGAGAGIGIADDAYAALGAEILPDADAVFDAAEMIVKVKEPQAIEIARLKPHHILFTYLHLARRPGPGARG